MCKVVFTHNGLNEYLIVYFIILLPLVIIMTLETAKL